MFCENGYIWVYNKTVVDCVSVTVDLTDEPARNRRTDCEPDRSTVARDLNNCILITWLNETMVNTIKTC